MRPSRQSHHFIIEAFDRDLWCPVAQTLFQVDDLARLRTILALTADKDPDLEWTYHLDDDELAAVVAGFAARFERSQFGSADLTIGLFRWRGLFEVPYLVHTGYELPLLLEGRKKIARFSHEYPPETFEGEHRFDHWVDQGVLHREEVIEPFDEPIKSFLGLRTVYYTPKGEEWRIPALRLVVQASGKSGGWNEHFERLEGMLFGYEDWQNDWWINEGVQGGGFGGIPLYCAVTRAGLAWIEAAGFRALPPIEGPALVTNSYRRPCEADLAASMLENPDHVAVIRFNVMGRHLFDFIDLPSGGPWHIPAEQIAELNRHLRGDIEIVAHRSRS
jgi:hypothetical protein